MTVSFLDAVETVDVLTAIKESEIRTVHSGARVKSSYRFDRINKLDCD